MPKMSKIHDNNFIIRMLYKDVYWLTLLCLSLYVFMMRFVVAFLNEYEWMNEWWFLPHDAYTERGFMPQYVVRPSVSLLNLFVRPSVTFRYRDHIGWNSSKINSRPNGLRLLRGWPWRGRSIKRGHSNVASLSGPIVSIQCLFVTADSGQYRPMMMMIWCYGNASKISCLQISQTVSMEKMLICHYLTTANILECRRSAECSLRVREKHESSLFPIPVIRQQ